MREEKGLVQDKYNNFLNQVLEEKLFASGNELRKKIVEKFPAVTETYARKILTRAVADKIIRSSSPYTFGKGQYIYLYEGQNLDKEKIKSISEKNRPPIFRLLEFMDMNNGIISSYEAAKITASPVVNGKTKVQSIQDIVKILRRFEVVYEKMDENGVNYILYKIDLPEMLQPGVEKELMANHYSKMVLDSSLIPDIIRWVTKANLIDNLKVTYRNKKRPQFGAIHNNLVWDVIGYTKSTGINHIVGAKADTIEKQTLVALDIVIATEYSQEHLDGFLNRVQINLNSVVAGERKILPIIFYRTCSDFVLHKISKLGFIAFDVGSVFGTKIYYVLQKLKEVNDLVLLGGDTDRTIDEILKTIREAGQEDALKDVKGVLFEVLMYPLLKNLYPDAQIERNKILKTEDGKKEEYEYDYIIKSNNPKEIVIVELKGYNSNVRISLGDKDKKQTLKWFFNRTIPFAKTKYGNEIGEGKLIKAVYMTTAGFYKDTPEFIEAMNNSKLKAKNLNVAYNREELIELLTEKGFMSEVKTIKDFYTKEGA